MVMPPRRSSGMQSICQELQRRRPKPLAPKSSATKKPSAAPRRLCRHHTLFHEASGIRLRRPPPQSPHQAPPPPMRLGLGLGLRPAPLPSLPPCRRLRPDPRSAQSTCPSTLGTNDNKHLSPGTEVGVHTSATKLKTGEVLVLWLRATVDTPTHDGYEVVYDGDWPPGDPYGTVCVPRRHVWVIKSSPSPMPALSAPCSFDITPPRGRRRRGQRRDRPQRGRACASYAAASGSG
ncbi:unnamed protein product [Urochloa humidicola]